MRRLYRFRANPDFSEHEHRQHSTSVSLEPVHNLLKSTTRGSFILTRSITTRFQLHEILNVTCVLRNLFSHLMVVSYQDNFACDPANLCRPDLL